MKPKILAFVLFSPVFLQAQLHETFSDGDFSFDPPWTGNSLDWKVSAGQLQSNHTTANSSFYLSTANFNSTSAIWELYTRLHFNTSSANYVDIFLVASASDLSLVNTSGYFVRIGSTQDDVCLYRKDANGSLIKLIDGQDGLTNSSDNTLKIKVTRSAAHQFTLYVDVSGTGNNYISEGQATDASFTTSAFFGILIKQSTSSFFQKHFFDDILIQNFVPDINPPLIQSINVISANQLDILFSEPVEQASSQNVTNYMVNNGIGSPLDAVRDAANSSLVHLTFTSNFSIATYLLTMNGVKDLAGNAMSTVSTSFEFYSARQYDIVIDEIMADPAPQVLLPNSEFIELKNTSSKNINLDGWKLLTLSSTSASFPPYVLPPDSFLIVTSTSNTTVLNQHGKTIGISGFPTLANTGGLVALVSKEAKTIHAVEYSDEWYGNPVKTEGGWTLEMIDPKNPCQENYNWKGSTDISGGTPGRKNAVDGNNPDETSPQLLRTYTIDSVTIVAVFDETLDSLSAALSPNYELTNNTVIFAAPRPPLFKQVVLQVSIPLQKSKVETLSVSNLVDCKGNAIGSVRQSKLGLPEKAEAMDIAINEILFNPRPNAFDYLELYNRSNKIIDVSNLYLANRVSTTVGSLKKLSENSFLIFPGQYLVITEDAYSLKTNYLVKEPGQVLELSSLPSYPDDQGIVVLTNGIGEILDEVAYEEDWHFALISETEGVSLERIDQDQPTQNKNNWHSAAGTAGYGTPTYRNSQYRQTGQIDATITVSPPIFSPDNDGYDDVATISYHFMEPGYIANVSIFDAAGRLIRYLVKNELAGIKGNWNWDGLGEKNQKLPIGHYVIYTEIFNLQGKKKQFRNIVVLARKL